MSQAGFSGFWGIRKLRDITPKLDFATSEITGCFHCNAQRHPGTQPHRTCFATDRQRITNDGRECSSVLYKLLAWGLLWLWWCFYRPTQSCLRKAQASGSLTNKVFTKMAMTMRYFWLTVPYLLEGQVRRERDSFLARSTFDQGPPTGTPYGMAHWQEKRAVGRRTFVSMLHFSNI